MRIGIVLSAGGLRGAAHLGVLRGILRHHVPVDVIVGVSAGAIIAAYYAAVGLTVNDMIDDAPRFRGRHLLMHGLTLRAHPTIKPYLRPFCGVIPERLRQLEKGRFDGLHHGIQRLGIVCHDLISNQPRYFSTTEPRGARLADVVKASASVPGLLPTRTMTLDGEQLRLTDGGLSDSLPIDFARSPELGATHLIVSDCRYRVATRPATSDSLVYIRPDLDDHPPLRAPRFGLLKTVWQGESSVTPEIVERIRIWLGDMTASPLASGIVRT